VVAQRLIRRRVGVQVVVIVVGGGAAVEPVVGGTAAGPRLSAGHVAGSVPEKGEDDI